MSRSLRLALAAILFGTSAFALEQTEGPECPLCSEGLASYLATGAQHLAEALCRCHSEAQTCEPGEKVVALKLGPLTLMSCRSSSCPQPALGGPLDGQLLLGQEVDRIYGEFAHPHRATGVWVQRDYGNLDAIGRSPSGETEEAIRQRAERFQHWPAESPWGYAVVGECPELGPIVIPGLDPNVPHRIGVDFDAIGAEGGLPSAYGVAKGHLGPVLFGVDESVDIDVLSDPATCRSGSPGREVDACQSGRSPMWIPLHGSLPTRIPSFTALPGFRFHVASSPCDPAGEAEWSACGNQGCESEDCEACKYHKNKEWYSDARHLDQAVRHLEAAGCHDEANAIRQVALKRELQSLKQQIREQTERAAELHHQNAALHQKLEQIEQRLAGDDLQSETPSRLSSPKSRPTPLHETSTYRLPDDVQYFPSGFELKLSGTIQQISADDDFESAAPSNLIQAGHQEAQPGGFTLVPTDSHLTNGDVEAFLESGVPEPIIVNTIRHQDTKFRLSSDAIQRLKDAGASDAVIQHMRKGKIRELINR